ncbi:MAG: DUF4831 family protein [Bacteroidales bacterium]|nr:DUF4831 family protein [Bacteroidales bacterium]
MKQFLFIILLIPFLLTAQTVTEGQPTLIYSLPKTEFVVHATVEKITETPGQFYQYSERYLATSDVITSKRTYYRLKSLDVIPSILPDKERTFTIIPKKRSLASLITVTEEGILCGINTHPIQINKEKKIVRKEADRGEQSAQKLLPLSEEYMLAGSEVKMAEGVAKQIYSIRENRADLLAGDVEYVPTDGASMKTMIEQMNQQEEVLTKLFVGTTTVEELTQEMTYTPTKAVKDEVAFRFSEFQGLVPADDLSGSPYYISISFEPVKAVADEKKKKAKEEVFSIIPVLADVILDDGEKVFFQKEITIPQLGILMPIPLETMNKYSRAFVSPETGRLLSVEQGEKK